MGFRRSLPVLMVVVMAAQVRKVLAKGWTRMRRLGMVREMHGSVTSYHGRNRSS